MIKSSAKISRLLNPEASLPVKSVTPETIQTDFSADKLTPEVGETVQFTDESSLSPTKWGWFFGDGNSSEQQNPTHSYQSTGKKTVTLHAGGTSDNAKDAGNVEEKVDYIDVVGPTPGGMFTNDDFFWINTDRSPVTLDGSGNVQLIENLGNFGGDMQQGTASNRPGYGITQLNGKDVIDLDGVSEFLESTLPAGDWSFLHDGTLYSILTVFKPGNTADPNELMPVLATSLTSTNEIGFQFMFADRDSQSNNNSLRHTTSNSGGDFEIDNQTQNNYVAANNWHHAEVRGDPSNSTAEDRSIITADGQSEEKNNALMESPIANDPQHTLQLGMMTTDPNNGFMYTGQIAETVIIKGRMITANELAMWSDYVQNEWGI